MVEIFEIPVPLDFGVSEGTVQITSGEVLLSKQWGPYQVLSSS